MASLPKNIDESDIPASGSSRAGCDSQYGNEELEPEEVCVRDTHQGNSDRSEPLTSEGKFSNAEKLGQGESSSNMDLMEDGEFWSLLSTALNESSGEDNEDDDDDDCEAILQQILDMADEKPVQSRLHKTPHLYSHYEILNHNFQEFKTTCHKDPANNIFSCIPCNHEYACSTALTRHLKTHVCGICNKFFKQKSDLSDHKWNHRSEMVRGVKHSRKLPAIYTISKQNRILISRATSRKAKEKKYLCKPCSKNFLNHSVLMRHMATHICKKCDRFFGSKDELKQHVKTCKTKKRVKLSVGTGEQGASCQNNEECRDQLPSKETQHPASILSTDVSADSTVHTKAVNEVSQGLGQPISGAPSASTTSNTASLSQCLQTRGTSSTGISLDANSRLGTCFVSNHTVPKKQSSIDLPQELQKRREKSFQCRSCDKCFLTKGVLKSHMQTHVTVTQHECQNCGKCFRSKHALQKHSQLHRNKQVAISLKGQGKS